VAENRIEYGNKILYKKGKKNGANRKKGLKKRRDYYIMIRQERKFE
jgi:hypothetical protein